MDNFNDMFVGRKSLQKEHNKTNGDTKTTTTIYGPVQDIQLIDNLVWLKTHADYESATRGTVVEEAIALLADAMDYETLRKKFEQQLSAGKAKVGRRANKKDDTDTIKTSISIYTTRSNVTLLDNLVWLRTHVLFETASRGTVIGMGLELMAKDYGYEKLAKKYKKHLPFP